MGYVSSLHGNDWLQSVAKVPALQKLLRRTSKARKWRDHGDIRGRNLYRASIYKYMYTHVCVLNMYIIYVMLCIFNVVIIHTYRIISYRIISCHIVNYLPIYLPTSIYLPTYLPTYEQTYHINCIALHYIRYIALHFSTLLWISFHYIPSHVNTLHTCITTTSGQIMIFHQPKFSWNEGFLFLSYFWGEVVWSPYNLTR